MMGCISYGSEGESVFQLLGLLSPSLYNHPTECAACQGNLTLCTGFAWSDRCSRFSQSSRRTRGHWLPYRRRAVVRSSPIVVENVQHAFEFELALWSSASTAGVHKLSCVQCTAYIALRNSLSQGDTPAHHLQDMTEEPNATISSSDIASVKF